MMYDHLLGKLAGPRWRNFRSMAEIPTSCGGKTFEMDAPMNLSEHSLRDRVLGDPRQKEILV